MGSMELFIFLLEKGPKIGDYQYEVPVEEDKVRWVAIYVSKRG